ncbi:SRPBCC family protein [Gordonia sp. CPCC 205515]|uniref:SRPBCC family protein n=1 Tax=Gordonia sp. CPCC 205515 TaxID=3140791 RepID=UPI003AF3D7E4
MIGRLARHNRTEVLLDAPAEALWHILVDVTRVGEWSHECRGARWTGPDTHAAPGVRFRGTNRSGRLTWLRTCEFTVVEPPRTIGWKTLGLLGKIDRTDWRIELTPTPTGTRVVQTYDVTYVAPGFDRIYWVLVKAHRDRRDALTDDLRRLGELAVHQVASS